VRRAESEAAAEQLGVEWLVDADLSRVRTLPDETLRRRAHHVVTEAARVEAVVTLLRAGRPEMIGGFLTQSHQSLSEDFEVSCVELDTAVDAAVAAGALGARMTGGGFGGSAIVLCRHADSSRIRLRMDAAFDSAGLHAPEIWAASTAPGARRFAGLG
jgi:galactokinase